MSEIDNLYKYPQIIREFASYKLSIQGCSTKTVEEYVLDLRTFMRYIIARDSGMKLTDENLESVTFENVDVSFFEKIKDIIDKFGS